MKARAMSRLSALALPGFRLSPLRFGSAILRALTLRRSRQRLASLEPHMLRDIGLSTDQALHEAARPLWDAPEVWKRHD